METLKTQLIELKKDIYIKLLILDIISEKISVNAASDMLNIMNSMSLSRSWIGKALSYIRGTSKKHNSLREHIAHQAELSDNQHPEGNIDDLLLEYQSEIQQLINDLSSAYKNPGVAELDDNALMCLEYAWQHLNQADFHLAYLIDYRITMQQTNDDLAHDRSA